MAQGRPRHQPVVNLDKGNLVSATGQHAKLSLVDRIFEMVVGQIRANSLPAGQRLHSVRQLADSCEVSRDTVARAYDKLVAHGYLESRAGSGFYVKDAKRHPALADATATAPVLPTWSRLRLVLPSTNMASTTGIGLLPAEWMDDEAVSSALRTVARANSRNLASYGEPLGYLPLRQQIHEKLKAVQIQAPASQIMTTMGATDALHLVIMSGYRTASEYVLVEQPGPFLLTDRLMASGLYPLAVPRLTDGPDLDVLRALCEQHRPRFFFCSSVLHSPTSSQMAPHKAYQILRLAEEFNFTIVEDDTYSDLMHANADKSVTRLASLDQLQRVIYIGSFSKTIAPGLRAGFVCAHPSILEGLLVYRTVSQISGSSHVERALYQLLTQGGYRHHCTQLRSRLDELRLPVMEQLKQLGCTFEHVADAGMYVWATLPDGVNATVLADGLFASGHLMAPGSLFSTDKADASKMRFNIGRTLDSPVLAPLAKLLRA